MPLRRTPLILTAIVILGAAVQSQQGVTPEHLARTAPTDSWPTYHGDYSGRHYSALTQIDRSNVNQLELIWTSRPTGPTDGPNVGGEYRDGDPYFWFAPPGAASGAGPGEPIAVDGRIYVTTTNHGFALDARTGEQLWSFYWQAKGGAGGGNRGFAMRGDQLYFETSDCYLVSLDAKTGQELWHSQIADTREFKFCSPAPVVVKDMVITGMGGDGMDSQAWVSAFDAVTGEQRWRWYTTPQSPGDLGYDSWPDDHARTHGNSMPWQMPTYDPALNLIYVTTGNPNPVFAGQARPGDNLFSNSVVALNPDTGQMVWYFQFRRHETLDWDNAQVPVLIDGEFGGQPRKMLACVCASGYYFLLDRETGRSLLTVPFTDRPPNNVLGVDEDGMLIPDPAKDPTPSGVLVYPGKATNWQPPSFSPRTGLLYAGTAEGWGMIYLSDDSDRAAGWAGIGSGQGPIFNSGAIRALDYQTGKPKWIHRLQTNGVQGLLSTAGDVVFGSDKAGHLMSFDAETGKILWATDEVDSSPSNGPVTFMLDGKQILLVVAGGALYAFSL